VEEAERLVFKFEMVADRALNSLMMNNVFLLEEGDGTKSRGSLSLRQQALHFWEGLVGDRKGPLPSAR
jgi:hypothetical protein